MHFFQIGMKPLLYIYGYKAGPHLSLSGKLWEKAYIFFIFFILASIMWQDQVELSGLFLWAVKEWCMKDAVAGRGDETKCDFSSHRPSSIAMAVLVAVPCILLYAFSEISIALQCIHFLPNLVRGNFWVCIINPAWCSTSLIKFHTAPFSFLHIQHCSLIFCFLNPACFF